ncbi:MAG: PQQ-binding-like beta-propeller repeat protein [Spirochaetes bacterium]|nr:PQQ-binding-like beta-propeller repeat protein [Spirochaetota bacterium]
MKKIILLFSFLCFFSVSNARNQIRMYVWADKVNVRDKPEMSAKAVFLLNEGDTVILTGEKSGKRFKAFLRGSEYDDFFYEITTSDGRKGWIYGAALTEYPLIGTGFKFKWKYKIGLTTFRSSIKYFKKNIYAGSNGSKRDSLNDPADGVYILDSVSGKLKKHISGKSPADTDVNGIAVSEFGIYFGSDDSKIFCYTTDGNRKIWEFKADGDIEGCPVLTDLDSDGVRDVVAASENNTVFALNGKNGRIIWIYHDNIVSEYEAFGFIASPACVDLNFDGTDDIIIGSRNNIFYALDGGTGQILWSSVPAGVSLTSDESESEENGRFAGFPVYSGIHASAFITGKKIIFAESYSVIHFLAFDGTETDSIELENQTFGIEGLFSSPVMYNEKVFIGSSWWGDDDNVWAAGNGIRNYITAGRVSSTCVIADVLGNGSMQVLFATERGELLILNSDGVLISRFKLPGGVEATPLVEDVDGDGRLEILIACLDGSLYCYETESSGKVYYGQFRGNNFNTGRVDGIKK